MTPCYLMSEEGASVPHFSHHRSLPSRSPCACVFVLLLVCRPNDATCTREKGGRYIRNTVHPSSNPSFPLLSMPDAA